ncbi:DNA adenine methylase [Escherichia coli]|nr:DNA adenine methylase [Escherichia coli]
MQRECKQIQCDLCYIDPPYMKRQYAANYHILETLARGDEPEAMRYWWIKTLARPVF